jgi:hypothetical protein
MEDGAYVVNNNLAEVATTFQIAGVGNFDGDSDSDIVWRHQDGTTVTWTMQDGVLLQTQNFGVVDTEWQIGGTGVFPLV